MIEFTLEDFVPKRDWSAEADTFLKEVEDTIARMIKFGDELMAATDVSDELKLGIATKMYMSFAQLERNVDPT